MASGGRYEIKNGKRVKIEGTTPHPDGNKPRPDNGDAAKKPAPAAPINAPKSTGDAS